MKRIFFLRLVLLLLALLLAATPVLCLTSCKNRNANQNAPNGTPFEMSKAKEIGSGGTVLLFRAVFADGSIEDYCLHTDETTVGAALFGAGLIAGETGPYGLYVKTVCGTTLTYERDGLYWAFYADGTYGMTGVDTTPIKTGVLYEFRAEKG